MPFRSANVPVVDCPPDKSITHRLFFFGAMARGESLVRNPLNSADTRATIECLQQLGVTFSVPQYDFENDVAAKKHTFLKINSPGLSGFKSPEADLNAGNSGTTARLLLGLLAACPGVHATLCGDASLSRRPMARVLDLLAKAGAEPVLSRQLPISLVGKQLEPFSVSSGIASAQVKTALILAAMTCHGDSTASLPAGARNHTEILCARLGLPVLVTRAEDRELIRISGPIDVPRFDLTVPGDPSSAAFLVAAGLLTGVGAVIYQVCANPLRTAFLDVLDQAGVNVTRCPQRNDSFVEAVENWDVPDGMGAQWFLRGAGEVPAAWTPSLIDEIPVLATVLAFGSEASIFRGVGELRVKESNRLDGVVRLLRSIGCHAVIDGDDLIVPGGLDVNEIPAFEFDCCGDHRLAMCAMILERVANKTCSISERSCVDVSFPDFPAVLTSWDSKRRGSRS